MPALHPVRAGAFSLLVLIFLAFAAASEARERQAILPAGDTAAGPYFALGELVDISGTVNGDLYAAGGQIIISGQVNGDVLAAGGTVLISGRVSQDVRMAGGQVTITGEIGRNLTLAAGQAELTPGARVGGGVVAAAGNSRVTAQVSEDLVAAGGQVFIDSRIGGDVQVAAGDLRLGATASIGGDLRYRSDRQAAISPQARIEGQTFRKPLPARYRPTSERIFGFYAGFRIITFLMNLLSTLILGLLFIHWLPRFSRQTAEQLHERPLASLGLGFAVVVLAPVLAFLLAMSILGLPLSLLLLTWLLPFFYLARIFPLYWLGLVIFRQLNRPGNEKTAFAVGLLCYYLLALIPVLSSLLTLFVVLFGAGMALIEKKRTYEGLRAREAI